MSYELLLKLDSARELAHTPFRITSSYRHGPENSNHLGLAVDVACADSPTRLSIIRGAIRAGFTRIGIYNRHIHLDINSLNKPGIWLGKSL